MNVHRIDMLLDVIESPLLHRPLGPLLRVQVERPEINRIDREIRPEVLAAPAIVYVIGAVTPIVVPLVTVPDQPNRWEKVNSTKPHPISTMC